MQFNRGGPILEVFPNASLGVLTIGAKAKAWTAIRLAIRAAGKVFPLGFGRQPLPQLVETELIQIGNALVSRFRYVAVSVSSFRVANTRNFDRIRSRAFAPFKAPNNRAYILAGVEYLSVCSRLRGEPLGAQ